MKKNAIFLLVVLLCSCICISTITAQTSVLYGDADDNGVVDIIDALIVAQYYVGIPEILLDIEIIDVSGDGDIDIIDALLIAQYYVGLITEFPVQTSVPTLTPNPEETPGVGNGYILHVECRDALSTGRNYQVSMSYEGDYSATDVDTPFDIGPYPQPFTVTITTPLNLWQQD